MQFGGFGIWEILLIILIALILFGPRKLPELAKAMGEAVKEFRKASSSISEGKEESTAERRESIRELALSLGIDVTGKTDEEILDEIRKLVKERKE